MDTLASILNSLDWYKLILIVSTIFFIRWYWQISFHNNEGFGTDAPTHHQFNDEANNKLSHDTTFNKSSVIITKKLFRYIS